MQRPAKSRRPGTGAYARGSTRPPRLYLLLIGLLFTLPLDGMASPFCSGASVYCWFADPPGEFEWPGAGVCKLNSYGFYEFCLLPPPQPTTRPEIPVMDDVVRPSLNKTPVPLWLTATQMFWLLLVVSWLTVSGAGFLLLARKVVRKARSRFDGRSRVDEPVTLPTRLVFVGAICAALVVFGGAYQLQRLHQVEIGLEDEAVAESDARLECEVKAGIRPPHGTINWQPGREPNPCVTKEDTVARLQANAGRIRFVRDWIRPVGMTLFLLFCVPWLFSRLIRRSQKTLA